MSDEFDDADDVNVNGRDDLDDDYEDDDDANRIVVPACGRRARHRISPTTPTRSTSRSRSAAARSSCSCTPTPTTWVASSVDGAA